MDSPGWGAVTKEMLLTSSINKERFFVRRNVVSKHKRPRIFEPHVDGSSLCRDNILSASGGTPEGQAVTAGNNRRLTFLLRSPLETGPPTWSLGPGGGLYSRLPTGTFFSPRIFILPPPAH